MIADEKLSSVVQAPSPLAAPSAPSTGPIKARHGAWTPWAQVLCDECDYAGLKDSPSAQTFTKRLQKLASTARSEEIEQPDPEVLIGTCDGCGCACWVRDDVALLQRVGRRASDLGCPGFALQQTGGMCAALSIETAGRMICLTAMDGGFSLGDYAMVGDEWWDHLIRTWDSGQLYEDGAWKDVEGAIEECARKAIEFIRHPEAPK